MSHHTVVHSLYNIPLLSFISTLPLHPHQAAIVVHLFLCIYSIKLFPFSLGKFLNVGESLGTMQGG